jgi:enolase-phosphatase E1
VIVFDGRGILLDVEGTTSSIAFVYDVLFAHAKAQLGDFLAAHADDPLVRAAAAGIAATSGLPAVDIGTAAGRGQVTLAAVDLMNRDVKDTGLKALQGMIWRSGFESGSIEAQKLFFGHTAAGDLTPHLRGHYDTTTGPKREAASYAAIAADMGLEPRQILFVSDVGAELDAARQAGMATALAVRPGNRDPGGLFAHDGVASFAEIVT